MFSLSFGIWLVLAIAVLAVSHFLEKAAAMRGSHRKPLSPIIDKSLRLFFLFLLAFPLLNISLWFLIPVLAYIPSYLDGSEKKFGRPSAWVRGWRFWNIPKRRFNLKLVRVQKLDPKKQYVLGFHPHGVLPFCGTFNLSTNINNVSELLEGIKIRFLAASICFFVPAYRDLCLSGGVCDAARYVAQNLLDNGYSVALCPGGASEALHSRHDVDILVLKKRRGFVSLAMRSGASLVPIFTFNETRTFKLIDAGNPWIDSFRAKFQRITGMSLPLVTNIIPLKTNATTVIGPPVEVPHIKEPTNEQIDEVLEKYIAALTKLYDDNFDKYVTDRKKNLQII